MSNSIALFSQNCDLRYSGNVLDIYDNQPQVKALVEFIDTDYQVLSDEDGNFVIDGICPGEYNLKITHPGCVDFFKKVSIKNNLSENIFVNHRINKLDEIFVEDLKQRKLSQTSIEKNFSQNFIQKFNSKNLADLVGTISGVSILKTGTNIVKPIINGVYGSRVLIIQDGSKLQDHEWGDDHAPSVDVNSIDRLQLIKGAMGLQYGNAIGGIIKISPIEFIPKDTLFGGIFASYHDNGKLNSSSVRINKTKKMVYSAH
jgi:iron complex outermembrane receptor protein